MRKQEHPTRPNSVTAAQGKYLDCFFQIRFLAPVFRNILGTMDCRQLGIKGVTLHSYRYAWVECAKTVGYPERFAQEALGHNSKAVHRAYAKRALMKIPSLEDYEQRAAAKII